MCGLQSLGHCSFSHKYPLFRHPSLSGYGTAHSAKSNLVEALIMRPGDICPKASMDRICARRFSFRIPFALFADIQPMLAFVHRWRPHLSKNPNEISTAYLIQKACLHRSI
jgi:hypothetical protein